MSAATPNRIFPTIFALNGVSGFSHLAQIGIIYPLISLWLAEQQVPAAQIGLVGSMHWAGMLLGILYAPFWMFRVGPRIVVLSGCVVTAVISTAMPAIPLTAIWLWCIAGAGLGAAVGLRWIGNESWLYSIIEGSLRGRIVGIHETLIHASQTAGPVLIAFIGAASANSFYAGAAFALIAMLPFFWATAAMPNGGQAKPESLRHFVANVLRHAPHSLGIRLGLLAGLVDGVLFGMLAVYVVKRGASATDAALVMTVFGVGGLVSSAPLGWLSDARGVRFAAVTLAVIGVVGAALLWSHVPLLLWPSACLLGVFAGMLTLAIIAGTQHAANNDKDMGVAIGEISISFTIGTILGPVAAGAMMDALGLWSFPALILVMCAAVVMTIRKRRGARAV
jgi:MFS family permease